MNKDLKIVVVLAVVGVIGFVAYKKLRKSYDPISFLDKNYGHVEEVSPNEHVHTHFFTVDGMPVTEAQEWIQITNLGPRVTTAMRDTVDRQIRSTMHVKPLAGRTDRLFGVMQDMAVHVYLMESTYLIYAERMVSGGEAEYREAAGKKFDAMEWIPADNL